MEDVARGPAWLGQGVGEAGEGVWLPGGGEGRRGRTHLGLIRRALVDTRGRGKVRGVGRASPVQSGFWGGGRTPVLGTEHRAHTAHSQHPGPGCRMDREVPAVRVSPALSWPVTGREDHRLTAFLGSSPGPGSWVAGVTHKGRMRYQGHGSSFIHERGGHGKTLRKYNSAATGSIKGLHPHLNQRAEPACATLAGGRYWGGWGLGK